MTIQELIDKLELTQEQLIAARICHALKIARRGIEINKKRAMPGSAMEHALTILEKDVTDILGGLADDKYISGKKQPWDK